MKTQNLIFVITVFLFVFVISCNSGNDTDTANDTNSIITNDTISLNNHSDTLSAIPDSISVNKNKKFETKYICPLGDSKGNADAAGFCPVCEMELIENPDYTSKDSNK